METVTSWFTLMRLARAVGDAKRQGNPEAIAMAEQELRSYEQLVLESDRTTTGVTVGDLY